MVFCRPARTPSNTYEKDMKKTKQLYRGTNTAMKLCRPARTPGNTYAKNKKTTIELEGTPIPRWYLAARRGPPVTLNIIIQVEYQFR